MSVHLNPSANPDADADSVQLAAWIDGIKSGDQTAAAELMRYYEPEVRRFVRFRLTDPKLRRLFDSADVCQSVMGRFFHGIQNARITVTHPLQLLKLLTTMARNSLLDHVRKARVRGTFRGAAAPEELEGYADPRAGAPEQLEQTDLVDLIRSRLRPDEQRPLDRWLLGCGWDEMSLEFGCEPDALRKRVTRALDRATAELGLLEDRNV